MQEVYVIWEQEEDMTHIRDVIAPDLLSDYIPAAENVLRERLKQPCYLESQIVETTIKNYDNGISVTFKVQFTNTNNHEYFSFHAKRMTIQSKI